ncbi:MAG: YcgN family cysteine cluster protein [Planctomycetota bacterium]
MNPKKLAIEVWEALCTKCGKCCTEKVEIDGTIYISKKYCRFLDQTTMECEVYENRFEAEPGCATVDKGLKMGIFPADCPYVEGIEGYVPAREEWDDPLITEAIRDILGEDSV